MDDLFFSFFNVFCLFIWFQTQAIIEYFKYIPILNSLFKIQNYYKYLKSGGNLKYPIYLQVEYDNFFTRLISCPYCLLFWINCFNLIFIKFFIYFFINYILSIMIYSILVILIKKYESIES